jgi:hypothetical protein
VVALVSGGCAAGVPGEDCSLPAAGTVLEQYSYEPYGTTVVAEDTAIGSVPAGTPPRAVNRVGFQGLFFERYDGDYTDPTIRPGVAGLYYARNRFYSPALGRFIQRDVNETALPIITALAMNGEAVDILMGGFDAQGLYGDGMNLYQFAGSNPVNNRDPSGLGNAGAIGAMGLGTVLWMSAAQMGQVAWNATQALAGQAVAYAYNLAMQMATLDPSIISSGLSTESVDRFLRDEYNRCYNWVSREASRLQSFVQHVGENASNSGFDPDDMEGQLHHAITKKIYRALENHPTLKGQYQYRDSRFTSRAIDAAAHNGYDNIVHRNVETEVEQWLLKNQEATTRQFETLLETIYNRKEMSDRFPLGLHPLEYFQ